MTRTASSMPRGMAVLAGLLVAALGAGSVMRASEEPRPDPKIGFPDFREWPHVKTMVIHDPEHPLFESFGGMHHVYANAKAFPSTTTMKPYPEGSVLVLVLYDLDASDGAFGAGGRRLTAVMERKDKYKETGGWAFQAWGRDGKPTVFDGGSACFSCHREEAASTGYVFSRYTP